MVKRASCIALAVSLAGPVSIPTQTSACEPVELHIQIRGADAAALGRVGNVRWAGLAVRDYPWQIVSVRQAEVVTQRVFKGSNVPRRFRYKFTSYQPHCGSPEASVKRSEQLVFLFERSSGKLRSYDAFDERTYRENAL